MKEQQEKIRVLDPHIILILFISAFVFGIGMLMIFLERKEIRTEGYEFIIFSVEILMLLLILYYMRTVVLSREGCTVSWLFWKRNYKWEELAVIREDVWYTYGKGGSIRYQGIVFSKYAVNKKKKKYTTRMIVDAFPLSDCFYITFDEHGNVFSYKLEKGKKQVIRKMYVNVREKMKEWGVEAEKGEGIKEEETYLDSYITRTLPDGMEVTYYDSDEKNYVSDNGKSLSEKYSYLIVTLEMINESNEKSNMTDVCPTNIKIGYFDDDGTFKMYDYTRGSMSDDELAKGHVSLPIGNKSIITMCYVVPDELLDKQLVIAGEIIECDKGAPKLPYFKVKI